MTVRPKAFEGSKLREMKLHEIMQPIIWGALGFGNHLGEESAIT